MTEDVALLVFLADEGFESARALAIASELPVEMSCLGSDDSICLGMLECRKLFGSELCTELCVLRLLQVGKEVFLSLSALVVAILLGVHGEFEEFLVVLAAIPTVVSHFLSESVEGIGYERVRVVVGKLSLLLLCQFDEFGSNLSRHITALAENHSPH